MKKKLCAALSLCLCAALTACAGSAAGGGNESVQESQSSGPVSSSENQSSAEASSEEKESAGENQEDPYAVTEPITITFWHTVEEQYRDTLQQLVDQFEEENPLITVEVVYSGSAGDTEEKFIAANVAGGQDLPTVLTSNSDSIVEYQEAGIMEPLQPYFEADQFPIDEFADGMVETFTWDGDTIFLPFLNSACVWFYNKDAVEAEGITMPETWEDMEEFVEAGTKDGRAAICFGGWDAFYEDPIWVNEGTQWVKEDGTTDVAEGPALALSQQIQQWVRDGKAAWAYGSGASANMRTAFSEGKYLAVIHSTGIYQTYLDLCDFEVGMMFPPAGSVSHISEVGGTGLGIPANISQEQKNAAWQFIKFMTSPESNMAMVEATGYLPTRTTTAQGEMGQAYLETYPEYADIFENLDSIVPRERGTGVASMKTLWENAMGQAMLENLDVKETLESYLPQMNAALAGE